MTRHFALTALATTLVLAPLASFAADSGQPTTAEQPFVTRVSADLTARFSTPEAARKAGYLRYTYEDATGAISYANRKWDSADAEHPSQLWFDAKNRLIGADYSVPMTGPTPPERFGLLPSRWQKFPAHVHYGLVGPGGTAVYGGAGEKTMAKGGASVAAPTSAALVKAGVAKKRSDVRFVFTFPAIWDATIWLVPNPDGAFAEKNPDVKPVNPPKKSDM